MRKKNIRDWLLLVLLTAAAFVAILARTGATELTLVRYEVTAELTQPLRIVQLSDLHGHSFGENNQRLAEVVEAQRPDLIFMTGDMLDKSDENPDIACELIEALSDTAPVYYCYGNHETSWISRTGKNPEAVLTQAGAVVLDTEYVDITLKGQALRIGGFHGYYRYPGMLKAVTKSHEGQKAFFENFEDTDRYTILLDHIPTGWVDWGNIHSFPVDLVLTGHYHGGQIRIPFVGGIYAPYIGFFPENTEGMFAGDTAVCILSTGLGSSPGIPRIHNPAQVVVVDLIPGETN